MLSEREACMTPTDLRTARKTLGLTQTGLADALRLSPRNGSRSIRIWEREGNTVPGPVQVAVAMMLERISHD
jgi:DNA-binding transcriptional regulator YiaG